MNSEEEILERVRHYCAYQERTVKQVKDKLKSWKANEQLIQGMINTLMEEGFLDEQRYADAFTTGKLKNNQWGKRKIRYELTGRGIPSHITDRAIQNIDEDQYMEILHALMKRKQEHLEGEDEFTKKNKVIRYLNGKGFSYDEIMKAYEEIDDQ